MSVCNMLVMADSPNIHKLIRTHLASEPVRIHSAYDGESGLTKADAIQPNLVLMDFPSRRERAFPYR